MKKEKGISLDEYDKTKNFIKKSRLIHGNKYDYSNVQYTNSKTKVCVICPIHGEFWVRPDIHLMGCLCKKCNFEKHKKKIYEKGINDLLLESHTQAYKIWKHILTRCYNKKFHTKEPTYSKCIVCDEWLLFSNFKIWFDVHYVNGWELDKDILVKGNKVYSPQTCCFVPHEINGMFAKTNKKRGIYPIGVNKHGNGFRARIVALNETINIGTYKHVEDAFNAYKREKEKWIKEVADKWKDQLEPRVYEALYNYKVEITD